MMSDPLQHSTYYGHHDGEPVIAIYYGHHDGERVTVTATQDDSQALPYAWRCTCGVSKRFATEYDLEVSGWRHAHPTRWKSLTRRLQQAFTRRRRSPES
ncbi:hypothetical protein ACWDSL_06730 [Streptomyces sp. NPDC000941]